MARLTRRARGQRRPRSRAARSAWPRRTYVKRAQSRRGRWPRKKRRRRRTMRGGKTVNLGFSKVIIPSANNKNTFLPSEIMNAFWGAEGALANLGNIYRGRPQPIQNKANPWVQKRVAAPKITANPDIMAVLGEYAGPSTLTSPVQASGN